MRRILHSAYVDVFLLASTANIWFIFKDTEYEAMCAVLVVASLCALGLTLLSNNNPWLRKRE